MLGRTKRLQPRWAMADRMKGKAISLTLHSPRPWNPKTRKSLMRLARVALGKMMRQPMM